MGRGWWLLALITGCVQAAELPVPTPVRDAEEAQAVGSSTMLVVDRGGDSLIAFDSAGELVEVLASSLDRPSAVVEGAEGVLYVASFGDGSVLRIDGKEIDVFFSDSAWLEEPIDLLFRGPDLYVLGNDTKNAVLLDTSGGVVKEFGHPTMRDVHGFAIGRDGLMYVAAGSHPTLACGVQVWDADRGALAGCFGTPGEVGYVAGLAFGPDGELWVSDLQQHRIVRFDSDARCADGLVAGEGELIEPLGLAIGPDGRLYVADAQQGIVRFERESGELVDVFVPLGTLVRPRSLTFVPDRSRAAPRR